MRKWRHPRDGVARTAQLIDCKHKRWQQRCKAVVPTMPTSAHPHGSLHTSHRRSRLPNEPLCIPRLKRWSRHHSSAALALTPAAFQVKCSFAETSLAVSPKSGPLHLSRARLTHYQHCRTTTYSPSIYFRLASVFFTPLNASSHFFNSGSVQA